MQFLALSAPQEAASVWPWALVAALVIAAGGGVLGWIVRRAVERAALRNLSAYESELTRATNCARDRAVAEKGEIEERYTRLQREHATCKDSIGGMQNRLQDRDSRLETLEQQLTRATQDGERQTKELLELNRQLTEVESAIEKRARLDGVPNWLYGAPNGTQDDLTAIRGLGRIMEQRLNALGIFHFKQLAQMTPENIGWIALRIHAVPGRLLSDRWAEQAQSLQSASD